MSFLLFELQVSIYFGQSILYLVEVCIALRVGMLSSVLQSPNPGLDIIFSSRSIQEVGLFS